MSKNFDLRNPAAGKLGVPPRWDLPSEDKEDWPLEPIIRVE